jgi:hypothetical protein
MARITAAAAIDKEQGNFYVHGFASPALLMTIGYNE